jgi:hypothetical protein
LLTLVLQSMSSLLKLAFVLVALAIVRRQRNEASLPAACWRWVGLALLVSAASDLLQSVWAVAAVAGGEHSRVYQLYLAWMPAMNYSRYAIAIGLGLVLTALPFAGDRLRLLRGEAIVVAATAIALVGVAGGLLEGGFTGSVHTFRLAVLQVAETSALFAALLVAVVRTSMDGWLWLTLFVYTFRQAVESLLWSAQAGSATGAWHPPFWASPAIGVVMWLAMVGLAHRRLTLARRDVPAPGIFAR